MSGKKTKINYEMSDDDVLVCIKNKYSKTLKTFVDKISSKKEKQNKKKVPSQTVSNPPQVTRSNQTEKTSNKIDFLIDVPEGENHNETQDFETYENNVEEELVEKLQNSSFDESFEFKTRDKRLYKLKIKI